MMEDYGFNVGGCWSYKVGAAQGYCKNSLGKAIILRGYIRTDDIDFVKTALLNFKYPTEHEIRVKPFAKVELFNFSFGKGFDEGFDTINFEKPLIVSSTYSGNKQKNFKGIMAVDDGFGGVSFVDVNKKPMANDEYFSKLNEYINSLESFEQLRNNKHFVYVDTYGEIVILAAGGKVNFYHINKKRIVSDIWFDRFKLPEEKDANFREMFNTILAELENVIYAINVPDGTVAKTNLTYDDISKATAGLGNKITENIETEVEANEVSLDSFKKQKELAPKIWNGDKLNSRVRLKLLDIADDFWETTDIGWVKPKGIVLMGSICNYNWSKSSDIDLHLQVDFSEVDEKKDFVQEYFNGKKNEWNEEHSNLKIFGFPVELYVEDIDADTNSGGIYDLEENDWIKKPSKDGIKQIGLDKYSIKDKSAKIMTDIDDLYDLFKKTDDDAKLRKIGEKAHNLLGKIKAMRKDGLSRGGESDKDNIVYKVLRRTGYMDILWNLSSQLYDKLNSIDESNILEIAERYIRASLNEEVVADGNADHNPFKKRWKYERETLINYLTNYGEIMTSKENGKQYKVLFDDMLSNRIGLNYCLCIQWNPITMEPGNVIYVRALDKFTRKIFKPEFDTRGFDNIAGTYDDVV
jgi:hypothetical protein